MGRSRAPTPSPTPYPSGSPKFSFWNGLAPGNGSFWWLPLDVNVDVSFKSTAPLTGQEVDVQVDWTDHHSINLFANPEYQKVSP